MKVIHEIINGKIKFPRSMADMLENFRLYPDRGDMTSVRPAIRSLEMMLRAMETGEMGSEKIARSTLMGEAFWKEMKTKTQCILPTGFLPPTRPSTDFRDSVLTVMAGVQQHFDETIETTKADPRHDGAFGLVLFAMSYLLSMTAFHGHDTPHSRTVLRSIVEAFITLEYLGVTDDPTLWEQYRRYGAGQAKLAFLKNVREDDVPEFFDLHLMEDLANEDMWLEFEDVRIGNWAKTDLRAMAIACGVKDTYDRYYDWASGFSHGHWIAVRETAFVNCMNPLHRFHRIPGAPLSLLPSILPDAAKLVNRMLDRMNSLYPSYKLRITAKPLDAVGEPEPADVSEPKSESSG